MNDNGELVDAPCLRSVTSCDKAKGCPATDVYYKCKPGMEEYVIMCSALKDFSCVMKMAGRSCEPCCISDDCGSGMPYCYK